FVPDDRGRVVIQPAAGDRASQVPARFSHPDYGLAQGTINVFEQNRLFVTPLVKQGTPEHTRALKGTVLSPDNLPLAGAVVNCTEIRMAGEGAINYYGSVSALTDDKGRFAFYPPPARVVPGEKPLLIPPNSRYFVVAEMP